MKCQVCDSTNIYIREVLQTTLCEACYRKGGHQPIREPRDRYKTLMTGIMIIIVIVGTFIYLIDYNSKAASIERNNNLSAAYKRCVLSAQVSEAQAQAGGFHTAYIMNLTGGNE